MPLYIHRFLIIACIAGGTRSTSRAVCDEYKALLFSVTLKTIKKYEYLIFPAQIKRYFMKGNPIRFCIKACNRSCEQIRGIRHYDPRL